MITIILTMIGSLSAVLFVYIPLLNRIPGLFLAPIIVLVSVLVLQKKPDTAGAAAIGIGSGLDISYGTPGLFLIFVLGLTLSGVYIKTRWFSGASIRTPFILCGILIPLYAALYLAIHALTYMNSSYLFSINLWHSILTLVMVLVVTTCLLWLVMRQLHKSKRGYER